MIIISSVLKGQDAHYWTNQYGTRADLLGGIVIGSVKDLSSTYYNPGAISFTTDRSFVLSTHAFDVTLINLGDLDLDNGLYSLQTRVAPALFALRLNFDKEIDHHFVISFMTRNNFKFEINKKEIMQYEKDNVQGLYEYFDAEFFFLHELSEYWGGLTWAHQVRPNLGIGGTLFGAYRNQNRRDDIRLHQVSDNNEGSTVQSINEHAYNHLRLFSKFGILYEKNPYSVGLTITTPSVSLFGGGSMYYHRSATNIQLNNGRVSYLASNFQDKLEITYHSPLSIGIGCSYKFDKSAIHFSAEWFTDIPGYTVLKSENFKAQSSDDIISTDVYHAAKSVFNFGIGFQHSFNDSLDVYLSVATDYSSRTNDPKESLSIAKWDIYHITSGVAFTVFDYDITLGLSYGFGSSYEKVFWISEYPSSDSQPLDFLDQQHIQYKSIKVIFGISF